MDHSKRQDLEQYLSLGDMHLSTHVVIILPKKNWIEHASKNDWLGPG